MHESTENKPVAEQPAASSPCCGGLFPASRRLTIVALALNGIAAALVATPVLGYLLSPVLRPRKDTWLDLGAVDDFPLNQTRLAIYHNAGGVPWDGNVDKVAAYVQRLGEETFRVLAVNCTHLGCPVNWFPESGLFLCPCHGGVYYSDGARASGPPPRGLYEYHYRVRDGRLEVLGGHLPTLQDPISPREEA